jgi:cell division protein FtsB
MKMIGRFYPIIKNKYFISVICFVTWMAFFDPKDWGTIIDRKEKLHELQSSEQALIKQIAETRSELRLLKLNAETVERYSREKYLMKKDNEDLFLVKTR